MNFFAEAFGFIFDGANWAGQDGIGARLAQHLAYTGLSVLIAALVAVPIGLAIGHTGRGRNAVIAVTSGARALPSFGLLAFILLFTGLTLPPLIIVLAVLAIPPLLAGVYAGMEAIDRKVIDAARSMGMSEWEVLGKVEIPLALPLIIGGIRSSVLQVIATATIAGYFTLGALGRYLIEGLAARDFSIAIAGAILVTGLALSADALLALIQKLVVPRGVSRGSGGTTTKSRMSSRTAPAIRTPVTEG